MGELVEVEMRSLQSCTAARSNTTGPAAAFVGMVLDILRATRRPGS